MQQLNENQYVLSASDLTAFSLCEFAFLRTLDFKLGRLDTLPETRSPLLEHAARLGLQHEARQLAAYKEQFPAAGAVVEIPEARLAPDFEAVLEAKAQTLAALKAGADVVFQATFFEPPAPVAGTDLEFGFLGFADFLAKKPQNAETTDADPQFFYEVQDTKLTSSAKVTALLQLAAYAEQLEANGIAPAPQAALLHGDGSTSTFELRDIHPFLTKLRSRMLQAIMHSLSRVGADHSRRSATPTTLTAPDVRACFKCEICKAEMQATADLMMVAGMSRAVRADLHNQGVHTMQQLAKSADAIAANQVHSENATVGQLQKLAWQAYGQCLSLKQGSVLHRLLNPAALSGLEAAGEHDLFVTLSYDSFFQPKNRASVVENAAAGTAEDTAAQAISSLQATDNKVTMQFGLKPGLVFAATVSDTSGAEVFDAASTHSEKQLLIKLFSKILAKLQQNENAKIYHYGRSFRSRLAALGAKHHIYETQIAQLLTSSNLVDLQQVTQQSLLLGAPNYELESIAAASANPPAANVPGEDILNADELLIARHELARAKGDEKTRLASLIRNNLLLENANLQAVHSFLRAQKKLAGLADHLVPARIYEADDEQQQLQESERFEQSQLAKFFLEQAAVAADAQTNEALVLLAAAFDYHRRERVNADEELYWRLNTAPENWGAAKETLVANPAHTRITEWNAPSGNRRSFTRRLQLSGVSAESEPFKQGSTVRLVYEHPAPPGARAAAASGRWYQHAKVISQRGSVFEFEERLRPGAPTYENVPIAVVAGPPLPTQQLQRSLAAWATQIAQNLRGDRQLLDAGWELLQRAKPRLRFGKEFSAQHTAEVTAYAETHGLEPKIAAIALAVSQLDHSVLPVQGPPGAGKTYVAARVIKHLVAQGWRIGVVSQSHAVVENLLNGAVNAGVPATQVVKAKASGGENSGAQPKFTQVRAVRDLSGPLAKAEQAGKGLVVGGTAWTFSNLNVFAPKSLDLLVVDEGGQFGMVNTLAALRAAKNLMLVGDPQQLPQVSQGLHPVPIDASALGWLMQDTATLGADRGFFLGESWRMWPQLCQIVSDLSYEGKLLAAAAPRDTLSGWVESGLHLHAVSHNGRSSESLEEAEQVLSLCQSALNSATVQTHNGQVRPITVQEIIVVAPYNAQVSKVRAVLDAAGLTGIRVGTVDKFQGQEAQLAIVTLASSDLQHNPRGAEFLLSRNRLNVAISRAKWAAHLVYSPQLAAAVPQTAEELVLLASFLRLLEQGQQH